MEKQFEEELYLNDGTVLTQVPKYPDYYCDIENGKVYSARTGNKIKILKSHERPLPHNYVTTTIIDENGIPQCLGVHEICMAAKESTWKWKEDGLEVNHIDDTRKNDNRAENLELIIHSAQYTKSVRLKMAKKKQGSAHPLSRLNEDDVIEIRQRYSEFESGLKCEFVEQLADEYGVSESCINSVIYNYSWSHII
ncbi:hypothetical protein [Paenibacillus sp. Root444D2]|uniref:hypothetical protein n=1 Tax=Paenibacillus sp. Root444D2 TaxID=1736538 RepID=UPI00070B5CE1|nr:hypothetical protein [Paenibacillus sp. Root444D2]KQX69246.1 hypothetical protein ASD40_01730 [Paenibacillus sp. Root444D2]